MNEKLVAKKSERCPECYGKGWVQCPGDDPSLNCDYDCLRAGYCMNTFPCEACQKLKN